MIFLLGEEIPLGPWGAPTETRTSVIEKRSDVKVLQLMSFFNHWHIFFIATLDSLILAVLSNFALYFIRKYCLQTFPAIRYPIAESLHIHN